MPNQRAIFRSTGMDKIEIEPYERVGNIKFGSERETVRKDNGNFKEFRKSRFSKNSTDDFASFHVFYSEDDRVEAVEFFRESNLYFHDIQLFSQSYGDLKTRLNALDSNITEDESGIIYTTLGFSVYSPDGEQVESILVFEKGYYD